MVILWGVGREGGGVKVRVGTGHGVGTRLRVFSNLWQETRVDIDDLQELAAQVS